MALKVDVHGKEKGVCTVSVSGSLDTATYAELEEALEPVLAASTKVLMINMAGLTYISSMGIGVIIKARQAMEDAGGTLIMTNLQPQIKAVFEIIKALPAIRVFESLAEADEYLTQIQRQEIEKQKGLS
jgi:anti-anti-sigma factor